MHESSMPPAPTSGGARPHRRGRRPRWAAATLGALALVAFVAAFTSGMAPASAHAVLVSSDPGDDTVLAESPDHVTLTFNEHVRGASGAVRVIDGKGFRVDRGAADFKGTTVTVGLPPLKDGTYVVSWRVESADSHPVAGAFTFSVGHASAVEPGVADRYEQGNDRRWEIIGWAGRWLAYAGLLIAAGGVVFLLFVHDGSLDRARLSWTVVAAGNLGMVGALAAIPVHAALSTGLGLQAIGSMQTFNDTVVGRVGAAAGVAALGALTISAPVAVLMLRPGPLGRIMRATLLTGAALAVLGLALVGHSTATTPRFLVMVSDIAHLSAAAIWVGGLVSLGLVLRYRANDNPTESVGMVARFSTIAAASLAVVGVAGLILAWSEVRSFGALTSTTYGWTLLAKVAVVAVIVAIAAFNRFRLVPALAPKRYEYWEERDSTTRDPRDARDTRDRNESTGRRPRRPQRTESTSRAAMTLLRRTLAYEVVGVIAVLGITAALANITPARSAAASSTIFNTRAALGDGEVDLTVDPSKVGRSAIHLYLFDAGGKPADIAEQVTLQLALPARDVGPIDRQPFHAGEGHYTITVDDMSIAGAWQITVVARTTTFDEERATINVPISP